jgi:hypothetical protein
MNSRRIIDHLVGAGEQHRRNCEAKRLGGLEIDRENEIDRLLDRQVGGLCPQTALAAAAPAPPPATQPPCRREA